MQCWKPGMNAPSAWTQKKREQICMNSSVMIPREGELAQVCGWKKYNKDIGEPRPWAAEKNNMQRHSCIREHVYLHISS